MKWISDFRHQSDENQFRKFSIKKHYFRQVEKEAEKKKKNLMKNLFTMKATFEEWKGIKSNEKRVENFLLMDFFFGDLKTWKIPFGKHNLEFGSFPRVFWWKEKAWKCEAYWENEFPIYISIIVRLFMKNWELFVILNRISWVEFCINRREMDFIVLLKGGCL